MTSSHSVASSFRDPSGFVFRQDGILYRQINQSGQEDYERLMGSGLFQELVEAGLLVPHQEVACSPALPDLAYKIIKPESVPFVSYPYEWCFGQLKDAALSTLEIQKRALARDQSLKDSSAYNIQFLRGRPTLIDTLSFESYREGEPWTAYRQFCQHFLGPLALMAYRDVRLNRLLRVHIDGVPLDMASRLLPLRSFLRVPLVLHIHLHARTQRRYADRTVDKTADRRRMSKTGLLGLLDSLESGIRKLHWQPSGTEWADYYAAHNYSAAALAHKEQLVDGFLDRIDPHSVWDLGANVGRFGRLSSRRGVLTVACDVDPAAVELNYQACVKEEERNLLPLVMDLTNPSPSLGWHHRERMSFVERGPADAVLALALVHHLAIGNNVPLPRLAEMLAELGRFLIIEFIPKEDSQVQRLLATRDDIFVEYTSSGFKEAFSLYFDLQACESIRDSQRCLYLMQRKKVP